MARKQYALRWNSVQDDHTRTEFHRKAYCFLALSRLSHDLEVVLSIEDPLHCIAEQRVVVHQYYRYRGACTPVGNSFVLTHSLYAAVGRSPSFGDRWRMAGAASIPRETSAGTNDGCPTRAEHLTGGRGQMAPVHWVTLSPGWQTLEQFTLRRYSGISVRRAQDCRWMATGAAS